jgi:hypothetical protein
MNIIRFVSWVTSDVLEDLFQLSLKLFVEFLYLYNDDIITWYLIILQGQELEER